MIIVELLCVAVNVTLTGMALGACTRAVERAVYARRTIAHIEHLLSLPGLPPQLTPYRDAPDKLVERTPPGPLTICPACSAPAYVCDQCHLGRTDVYKGEKCLRALCPGTTDGNVYGHYREPGMLRFTHRTSPFGYCSPYDRVSTGIFRRCREPGIHVHQTCQRCGWRGTAIVTNPQPERLSGDSVIG